jgi:enoyl-CoA hydratase
MNAPTVRIPNDVRVGGTGDADANQSFYDSHVGGELIEREDVDGVAVVRLAHGKVNVLDLELLAAITSTFRELDADAHRAVVLTGAGRAFSAGVDLWRIADGGADYVAAFLPALSTAFEAVFRAGKPVVAAVNGPAIAGGCIFAACCDHRVIADVGASIGVTELLVGVPFPTSALEILAYAAGPPAARAAILGGAAYEPVEALTRGLVDEVVPAPALLGHAIAVARRLAAVPPDTHRLTKQQLHRATDERIARLKAEDDPRVRELWTARVADGSIRAYMQSIRSRPGGPRGPA